MPFKDPEKRREWSRRYNKLNKERKLRWTREHRERNPDCRKIEYLRMRENKPNRYLKGLQKSREDLKKARAQVLAIYGGKCECCNESTPAFLAIDHINGNGKEDRKKFMGLVYMNYLLKESTRREGYRILCHNCNFATRYGEPCPHTLG